MIILSAINLVCFKIYILLIIAVIVLILRDFVSVPIFITSIAQTEII